MENPKIKIESDGDITVVHLDGKHIKGYEINFHAVARDGKRYVKWDGAFHKRDEDGCPIIENDNFVTEKFHFDNQEVERTGGG